MPELTVVPLVGAKQRANNATDERDRYVVSCAARLFLSNGLQSVRMVDIAREAGVGVATVYRHFSTKSAIAISAATLLWERFNQQILQMTESDEFLALNGLNRLQVLLEGYCQGYEAHRDFVAFLDEFDHMVLSERIRRDDLTSYGAQIDSFYPLFEDAYQLGLVDGSIVRRLDFRPFYLSLAHALMGVAQKLHRGEIIPSDDFSGTDELRSITRMALWSLVSATPIPEVGVSIEMKG